MTKLRFLLRFPTVPSWRPICLPWTLKMLWLRAPLFALLLPLVRCPFSSQDEPSVIGPMVGHVGSEAAAIWAYLGPGESAELRWWASDRPEEAKTAVMTANADRHNSTVAELDELRPLTRYEYRLSWRGQTRPTWQGSFRTAPPPGEVGRFKMAVSSCMHIDDVRQSSWYLLLAQHPSFHLLLGDNVYADSTDYERLWGQHLRYRTVPEFAGVLRQVPTYAMWDDHDFGPNDSDSTAEGKEDSLRAFEGLWANPGAGTNDTPGAFFRFSWGEVDFFVLDGRYYRTPNDAPDDEHKRMLGDAQFDWLMAELRMSRAKFKVLASGSTLQASRQDGWRRFSYARDRLYRALGEAAVSGVLYLSGDLHSCLLQMHATEDTIGYPLPEVISSGITRSNTQGFATLEFDTAREDPSVRVQILHGDGGIQVDRTFLLSELSRH